MAVEFRTAMGLPSRIQRAALRRIRVLVQVHLKGENHIVGIEGVAIREF